MEKLLSIIGVPILGGVFVLIVAGGLGTIFSALGNEATIGIGLGIVIASPIVAGWLLSRRNSR
ncbi:MAG: hypothetical protein ACE5KI_01980 [Dehalococcoidia bacterium]